MNSIQATNAAEQLPLGGRMFPVRQLKIREWAELQAWLKVSAPSPVVEAVRALANLAASGEVVPPEIRSAVLSHAQEESRYWPPRIGTWAWIKALESIEGGRVKFLHRALIAGGTDISEDDASELVDLIDVGEMADLIRVCLHGDPPAPKAMTGSTTAPTTPPTPTNGA